MRSRFNVLYVLALVALIVAPSALSLAIYTISKNPNLRPLALTRENLAAYGRASGSGEGAVSVVAQVDWVEGAGSQRELRRAIEQAFNARGVEVYVHFASGAKSTRITYVVGYSRIGPYSTRDAAEGVRAAVAAYLMHAPT